METLTKVSFFFFFFFFFLEQQQLFCIYTYGMFRLAGTKRGEYKRPFILSQFRYPDQVVSVEQFSMEQIIHFYGLVYLLILKNY